MALWHTGYNIDLPGGGGEVRTTGVEKCQGSLSLSVSLTYSFLDVRGGCRVIQDARGGGGGRDSCVVVQSAASRKNRRERGHW